MNPKDMYRPVYHFMPEKHWMNDPNGPVWYNGYYHMFYQHNPTSDDWGDIHWGHAKSKDLANWEHLPFALTPDASVNEKHCFSGCLVLNEGVPTILYTSVEKDRNQRQWATVRLARSFDDMLTWQRESEPVLTQDIHTERVGEWRDPFVWQENGTWNMLLGGEQEGYGRIFKYSSKDLLNWKYDGIFFENDATAFLECPNLLRFGEKSVLIYSPHGEVLYHVGYINENNAFVSESEGVLDNSGRKGFYAPNTLLNDPKGRYLTWGWITEEARNGFPIQGYNGALSIPRVLTLDENNQLNMEPVQEYEILRTQEKIFPAHALNGAEDLGLNGKTWEISLHAEYASQDDFSIVLLKSTDGLEETKIHFSAKSNSVTLERALTSINNEPDKTFQRAYFESDSNKLDLHIYLDGSLVEIYINKTAAISGRLYPTKTEFKNVSIVGNLQNVSVQTWVLKPAKFINDES